MRPKQLYNLLTKTIPANLPVLIKGPPGCGKTDIVTECAEACGANLLVTHPVVSDPTDFKGLPAIVEGKAEFLTFGDLEKLLTAKTETVAFLDDLGQAPAVVQAAAMQLILARKINGHKVSDKVTFIAATNRREDRAGVTGILEPVKSRFATIVELSPNVDDWCEWAIGHGVPAEVIAFCRFRPGLMLEPGAPTNDIVNRPSPRTVTNMGKLYKLGIEDLDILGGAAGVGFSTEFIGYIRVYKELPTIESILENPTGAKVPGERNHAALCAIATALATKITPKLVKPIITYLARLPAEFAVMGMRDCGRLCEAVAANREFQKYMMDNNALLV